MKGQGFDLLTYFDILDARRIKGSKKNNNMFMHHKKLELA